MERLRRAFLLRIIACGKESVSIGSEGSSPSSTQNVLILMLSPSTVGSAAYNSTITKHTEVLPISVDIIGKSACNSNLPSISVLPRHLAPPEFFPVRSFANNFHDKIHARGSDGVISSLVESLFNADIITDPLAGQTITGGEVLYGSK